MDRSSLEEAMIRIARSALLALFLVPLTSLAGGAKDKVKPGSVDEQFLAMRKEYIAAIKGVDDEKKNKIAAWSWRRTRTPTREASPASRWHRC
jgi:hypothetical protein